MHPVEVHIEHMFHDLPETKAIKQIKADLIQKMTKRHNELINEGRSESEALGTVIIEIGDRDVLLANSDYDLETDLQTYRTHTLDETAEFLRVTKQSAIMIGLGIILILVGVAMPLIFESFGVDPDMNVGVILLFALIATGVGSIIYGGMKVGNMEEPLALDKSMFYLPEDDKQQLENDFKHYKKSQMFRIPLGVVLCILSPIAILFFSFDSNEQAVNRFGIPIMFILIGLGVFLFITYGMTYSAYEKLLNIGEYAVENRRANEILSPISGVYWMLVVVIYLAWSFISWDWHITWIIWPITGVIWGLINEVAKWRLRRRQ